MKKILFFAPRFHTNQIGLINSLLTDGWTVRFQVYKITKQECHTILQPELVKPSYVSILLIKIFGLKYKIILFVPKLYKYSRDFFRYKPDFVVIRGVYNMYSIYLSVLSKFTNTKIIFYDQAVYENKVHRLKQFLIFIFSAKYFTTVSSTSNDLDIALYKNFLNKKYFFIPFNVQINLPPYNNFDKLNNRKVSMMMIGKLIERKNHVLFIKALSQIAEEKPFLDIIGNIYIGNYHHNQFHILDKINTEISLNNKYNLLFKLHFNISYDKIIEEYSKHDIFILPAYNEPASISIIESLRNNIYTICSDTNGTKCYIDVDQNGDIFESDNLQSLVDCINKKISVVNNDFRFNKIDYTLSNISYLYFKNFILNNFS